MSLQSMFHRKKQQNPKLKAVFLNCSLKPSSEVSNTLALMEKLAGAMQTVGEVDVEMIHVNDYDVKYGAVNNAGEGDQWPQILEKISTCNIFIMGMPIWMGVRSSVAQLVIERLDGSTKEGVCPETGQFPLYGSVAGVVVTGNEDGAHDCIANTLANLLHFGVTVPPNTDVYWVGDAGPGASYIEAGGDMSPYVNRNVQLAAQNLVFGAKVMLENPYPTNLRVLKEKMMAGMQIKMAAMKKMTSEMRQQMEM